MVILEYIHVFFMKTRMHRLNPSVPYSRSILEIGNLRESMVRVSGNGSQRLFEYVLTLSGMATKRHGQKERTRSISPIVRYARFVSFVRFVHCVLVPSQSPKVFGSNVDISALGANVPGAYGFTALIDSALCTARVPIDNFSCSRYSTSFLLK